MRRQTVVVLVLALFGTVAVELRLLRPPAWSIALGYDRAAMSRWLPTPPRYAISLGYHAGLQPLLGTLKGSSPWNHAAVGPPTGPKPQTPATDDVTAGESKAPESAPQELALSQPGTSAASGAAPTPAPDAEPGGEVPVLDFAKIAPQGTSVLAGRAEPGSRVTVLEGDTPVGTATAGPEGDWSLSTEHRFAAANPEIALRTGEPPPQAGAEATVSSATAAPQPPSPPTERAAAPDASSPSSELIESLKSRVEEARTANSPQDSASQAGTPPSADAIDRTALAWPVVTEPAAANQDVAAREMKPTETPSAQPAAAANTATSANPSATAEPQTVIPVPMQFVYRETTLTAKGREALALLIEYVKLKRLESITLSGHADERGSARYNLELSRKRLDIVKKRLQDSGYRGHIELIAKGETEPFSGVDRSRVAPDELMQLDRRVELRHSH